VLLQGNEWQAKSRAAHLPAVLPESTRHQTGGMRLPDSKKCHILPDSVCQVWTQQKITCYIPPCLPQSQGRKRPMFCSDLPYIALLVLENNGYSQETGLIVKISVEKLTSC